MLRAIAVCLILSAAGGAAASDPETKSLTFKSVFPVMRNQVPSCLGTLIASGNRPTFLTTARCVYGLPNSNLAVQLEQEAPPVRTVTRVIVHPYYHPPSSDYNVAIIRVNAPAGGQQKAPELTPLEISRIQPTGEVTGLGWNLSKPESEPKEENGTVEERKSCGAKLNVTLSGRMVCANVPLDWADGSPLLAAGSKLVGVGSHRASGSLPKVFVNLANPEIYSFVDRYLD